jgi:transcriptional regulator with PAS, ATPase and Fis domain
MSRRQLEGLLANGEELVSTVQEYLDRGKLPYTIKQNEDGSFFLQDTLSSGELKLKRFITADPQMLEMKDKAKKASVTSHAVLISGPTGTGKEIIASSMIAARKGAFKAVNCAGIPETLIESILFGHMKGSFTGATGTKNGLITEAVGGVMFMDEIGELPIAMQAKLLRTLQENKICKVGAVDEEDIDCKFVFATNRDLEQMVRERLFREDLLARISTLALRVSPLTDRLKDCVPIAQSMPDSSKFLEQYASVLEAGELNLNHNVRSIQRYIIRYNVWGSIS